MVPKQKVWGNLNICTITDTFHYNDLGRARVIVDAEGSGEGGGEMLAMDMFEKVKRGRQCEAASRVGEGLASGVGTRSVQGGSSCYAKI